MGASDGLTFDICKATQGSPNGTDCSATRSAGLTNLRGHYYPVHATAISVQEGADRNSQCGTAITIFWRCGLEVGPLPFWCENTCCWKTHIDLWLRHRNSIGINWSDLEKLG